MVLRLGMLCTIVLCATRVFAQSDTTVLAPIEIYGIRITPYAGGAKVNTLVLDNTVQTLANSLSNEPSLFFKNYGNEQLSTISFRGTTASQTAVLWNGININSPTLGQTDFSTVPMFLFDEVLIQYGAGSALVGTDAIGGSVSLNNKAIIFSKKISTMLYQQVGSFGRLATGIKFNGGNNKWHFSTNVFGFKIKNNFPYNSPAVGFTKRQENAAVENEGIRQQIAYRINDVQQVSVEALYTHNFRQNQPTVTNTGANETIDNKALRLALHYDLSSMLGAMRVTLAHLGDEQEYTDDNSSVISTKQWVALLNVDKQLSDKLSVRWGGSTTRHEAQGDNYPSDLSESRYDAFTSLRYDLTTRWLLTANLRQTFYAKRYAPFSPSIGMQGLLYQTSNSHVSLRGQAARAFRIPTLNDRYWLPVGNQNLEAEDAWQIETGINWEKKIAYAKIGAELGYYKTHTTNMIVWLPNENNNWAPINLQKVNINGIESNVEVSGDVGDLALAARLAYSFTKSINEKGIDTATEGKQLPYVPLYAARFMVSAAFSDWVFALHNNYTSMRFISLENSQRQGLDPYFLMDAELRKTWHWNKIMLTSRLQAGNLFNLYYENFAKHAMPGRNFSMSISIHVNN
jgi:iron complex outermembrane receptor protein